MSLVGAVATEWLRWPARGARAGAAVRSFVLVPGKRGRGGGGRARNRIREGATERSRFMTSGIATMDVESAGEYEAAREEEAAREGKSRRLTRERERGRT